MDYGQDPLTHQVFDDPSDPNADQRSERKQLKILTQILKKNSE